jgi:hypothetical protein
MTRIEGTPSSRPISEAPDGGGLIVPSHLGGLWKMLPGIREVYLYSRNAGSSLGNPVISKAEKRPIDINDRKIAELGLDVEAATFHVWPSTFSDKAYTPSPDDVLREYSSDSDSCGESSSVSWEIISVRREMMETRIKLTVTQLFS